MIRTEGLTHIHLAVRDLDRAVACYTDLFGMEIDESRSDETMAFLRTPGARDMLTLRQATPDEAVGAGGGVDHFGFRLQERGDLDEAILQIEAAGGRLIERGEHAPGLPYAYVADLDGYVLEFKLGSLREEALELNGVDIAAPALVDKAAHQVARLRADALHLKSPACELRRASAHYIVGDCESDVRLPAEIAEHRGLGGRPEVERTVDARGDDHAGVWSAVFADSRNGHSAALVGEVLHLLRGPLIVLEDAAS